MNLPNKLTLSRIGLTFIFMMFLFLHWPYAKLCAIFIFLAASLTDYYDGKIAKKYHMITDFGKLMDPIADKILVLAAFLAFVELKIIPAWMVVIIISRELIITGLRLMLLNKKQIIAASKAGKHKTISQMFSIFIILIYLALSQLNDHVLNFRWLSANVEYNMRLVIYGIMFVTVGLTLTSGMSYLKNNIKSLR